MNVLTVIGFTQYFIEAWFGLLLTFGVAYIFIRFVRYLGGV